MYQYNVIFVAGKMEVLNRLVAGYHDLMDNKSDPRVNDWLLMSSPLPTLAICLTYVFTVKVSHNRLHNLIIAFTSMRTHFNNSSIL